MAATPVIGCPAQLSTVASPAQAQRSNAFLRCAFVGQPASGLACRGSCGAGCHHGVCSRVWTAVDAARSGPSILQVVSGPSAPSPHAPPARTPLRKQPPARTLLCKQQGPSEHRARSRQKSVATAWARHSRGALCLGRRGPLVISRIRKLEHGRGEAACAPATHDCAPGGAPEPRQHVWVPSGTVCPAARGPSRRACAAGAAEIEMTALNALGLLRCGRQRR